MKRYLAFAFLLTLCFFCSALVHAQTFEFAKLQGSPMNTTGWNPEGAAYVGNTPVGSGNSELILTNPVAMSSGSIFYETPINLSSCRKWYAEFDFRMFDGSFADGLTFCYLENPPIGYVLGGGMGIPANANGLKICLDTWRNCGADAIPKIEIRWGTGYDECNGQPTRSNNDGALSFMRSSNYNHCKIEYDQGNISVWINTVLFLTAFQTFNFSGYFGFTASTGGSTDRHSIKNVSIYTEMPPSVAGSSASICPGDSLQIGGTANPACAYNWTPVAGLSDPTIANPKVAILNGSINSLVQKYFLQTSFIGNPGCASKDSVEIKVFGRARPNFNFTPVCNPGSLIQFQDQSQMGDGLPNVFSQYWGFGDPNATPSNPDSVTGNASPGHTYSSAGPFGVWHSIRTLIGACRSDTFIIINPFTARSTAYFTSLPEKCLGDTFRFTDSSYGTSPIVSRYWDFGDNTNSSLIAPLHLYTSAGSYVVKLVVANSAGCVSDTFFKTINVFPLPTASFTSPVAECQSNTINFLSTAVPNAGSIALYAWNFGDGVIETGPAPQHQYFTYGNLLVTLKVTTDKGCTASVSKPILIHPIPIAEFSMLAGCAGSPSAFTNTSQLPGGSITGLTFGWKFNDPFSGVSNPDSSNLVNPVHTFQQGGNYNVTLLGKSIFGCSASKTAALTISGKPVVNIAGLQTTCSNSVVSFADASSVNFGGIIERRISWDWTNNPTVQVSDTTSPLPGKIYRHQYPSFGGNTAKQFVIRNLAFSASGCSEERLDTVLLLPAPQLVFANAFSTCSGTPAFRVSGALETSGMPGTGNYTGNGISTGGNFDPSFNLPGAYKVRYLFTAANGCSDSVFNQIFVNALPLVDAGLPKTILEGGTAKLDGSFSINVASVQWTPAITLDNAGKYQPLASPKTDTWYYVTGVSDKNCTAKDSVLIRVLPSLIIPNVFSPNGDGINDVWNIPYLSSYMDCNISVYDRYGHNIFTSIGYPNPWNGKVSGKDVPAGVYYYILDIRNGKPPFSGSVTVLR